MARREWLKDIFTYRETLPKHYVDRSEHRVLRLPFFILCWPLIMLIILPLTIDNWRYAREQRKKRAT